MKKYVYPLTAGALLGLSFTGIGTGLFAALAFFLLLAYHQQIQDSPRAAKSFSIGIFCAFLLFNTIACSWIMNASIFGGMSEILINSALMAAPWLVFAWAHRIKGRSIAKLCLLVTWLGLEYLHTNWELAWPWLHLGNSFASQPALVQWYRFTGVAGGSAWILLAALSADAVRIRWQQAAPLRVRATESSILACIIIVPIIISFTLSCKPEHGSSTLRLLAVQPNFDPYENDGSTSDSRLSRLVQMTDSAMTDSTGLVLWPESAVEGNLWENNLAQRPDFAPVLALSQRWPHAQFIVGAFTFRRFAIDSATATARPLPGGGMYDAYNSLVQVQDGKIIAIRHKSQLVLGVEKVPFPAFMQHLTAFVEWAGGSIGSLGADTSLVAFRTAGNETVSSLVCYESVFGAYAASQPASLITIHTNDGWWGNTLGHRQHFAYARLRAIENQRYVARSAYTGISGIIAPDGSVIEQLAYETAGTVTADIPLRHQRTFYSQTGDFIGRWAAFLACLLMLYLFVQSRIAKR